uniref:Uncharacterized mitochondrial protein AtMg00810-like n=1 Tax=Nicotiana tabacum TaxID=4097 RepID=A0A1S3XH06_TOBAC|nr:PREDICTED: uncharacterized mitochondrial protein AtMg00810-like [Nicotiana tabacum]
MGNIVVFVAVYVDDVILTGNDLDEINSLKKFSDQTFKIKDLEISHYFLGLEQSSLSSPHDPSLKLKADEGALLQDLTNYRKLVGKLNFLTNTRLDIAFSLQHLSQYMQNPKDTHLKDVYHVLRYLKGDPNLGIFLSSRTGYMISAFCD